MTGGWSNAWRACFRSVPRGWTDRWLALSLASIYTVLLLGSIDTLGYTRDEGFYFQAADSYQQWFEWLARDAAGAFSAVDRYWQVNHEHPALFKSLFAWSHMLLYQRLELFAWEGTSYRFPAMVLAGLGVGLTYLWGARARGRLVGLLAALWLAAMPRFFFHAHLACFDVPVVTSWLFCAYAYWRCLRRGGVGAALLCGVAFALALNSKHNSWFLPIVCGLHAALLWLPGVVVTSQRRLLQRRALSALLSMATVGPLLFYLTWPWIWHDTAARLQQYAQFHLSHVYYNMELLGQNYFQPPMPRHYAPLMTLATVPLVPLAAFLLAALALAVRVLRWGRWRLRPGFLAGSAAGTGQRPSAASGEAATTLLWVLALLVQYAAWLRTSTPIFGGTKHWMTAYPFLVLLAAAFVVPALRHGVVWLCRLLPAWQRARTGVRLALAGLLLALLVAAPVLQTVHSHPWGLSWYNVLVGGPAGGATMGLNRGFWGHPTAAVAGYLNETLPPNGRLFIHDTAMPSWNMLVRDGRVRRDIRIVGNIAQADMAIYHHELHMSGVEQQQWGVFGTVAPVAIAGIDGVPVVWCYRRVRVPR